MIKGKLTFHDPVLNCIRGNFFLPGKKRATIRRLCTLEEAAFEGVGKTKRKRTKTKFREFVNNLYDKKLDEILEKADGIADKQHKFRATSKLWMTHVKIMCKKNTVDKYSTSITHWLSANKDTYLNDINQTNIDKLVKFLTKRQNSLAYQESVIREIKIFFNWAEEQEFMKRVPKIKYKKPTKKQPKVYTESQLEELEESLREKIRTTNRDKGDYVNHLRTHMMLKLTGMRIGEIWSMELNRIELDTYPPSLNIIDVDEIGFSVKGRTEHKTPISEKLLIFLTEDLKHRNDNERWYLDNGTGGQAYSDPHGISLALSRWNKRLGITGVKRAHGYRATVVTKLGNLEVQTERTQKLVGHKDRKTTDGYFNTDLLDTKELVDKL